MIFLRQCFGTYMVWLSLGLGLFLSHTVTVSDLLAAVIVNVDVYASAKKTHSWLELRATSKPAVMKQRQLTEVMSHCKTTATEKYCL